MSNKVYGRKLGRAQGARKSLYRAVIRSMVINGSIRTTKIKAKNYQRLIDKLVSKAKSETISSKRAVYARLGNDRTVTDKFFKEVVPSLKDVKSGFTKRTTIFKRKGDNAEIVKLEWNRKEVKAVSRKKVRGTSAAGKSKTSGRSVVSKITRKGAKKK